MKEDEPKIPSEEGLPGNDFGVKPEPQEEQTPQQPAEEPLRAETPPPLPPEEQKTPEEGGKSAEDKKETPQKEKDDKSPDSPFENQKGAKRFMGTWLSVIILACILSLYWWRSSGQAPIELDYNPDFKSAVEAGMVSSVSIVNQDGLVAQVKGELGFPKGGSEEARALESALLAKHPGTTLPCRFFTYVPSAEKVGEALTAQGIGVTYVRQSERMTFFLVNILPTLLLIGVIYWIYMRQSRSANQAMGFGKSRARRQDPSKKPILFKDVAGCDEAKEEVQEVVDFLKDPGKFSRLGGKMPHGILLSGPPGTGKTLIAKAIAGEAGVPFYSISGSDFVEMFVGVGASRVRDMFEQAKKTAPCLVFIDEIDAVGRRRGTGIGGGHDEREQTLNSLLVEMDGFEANEGIVVIAATNRPDVLDPALLRPGRFDRQLVVDLPTMKGREEILQVHAKRIKLAEGTDLSIIARGTPGCSGADLANIVNEAALLAARQEKPAVDLDDFEEALDKVLFGKERRSHVMDDEEKRRTAIHESGHAILGLLEPESDPVHKVTIIPRGMALGITAFLPAKDRVSVSRGQLMARITVAMGGRVAEELFLPDICTGASQDLRSATDTAHAMVCDWGMSPLLGPRRFGHNEELMFLGREVNRSQDYSEQTAQLIDQEVSRILNEAHTRATELLSTHREALEEMVRVLLEKETITGAEARDILETGHIRTAEESGKMPPPLPETTA